MMKEEVYREAYKLKNELYQKTSTEYLEESK